MSSYRILSLDGGGIRGILTATLLERLEKAHPGFISQFNLFAGTSTGGILALGLAYGFSPTEARLLYERCGEKVFKDSLVDDLRDLKFGDLPSMTGADYSTEPLKEVLSTYFGEKRLIDLPKKVLVSTFDLDNDPQDQFTIRTWKAKFFHNYTPKDNDSKQLVVDVAVRTSAAPTFFPVYQGYIDGGVVANNPSVCALAQALHKPTGGQVIDDLVLLSVGTGINPHYLKAQDDDWGLVQWAPHMLSLMLEGGTGVAEYQCRQILEERFLRINPILPLPIALDRIDQIPLLKEIAMQQDLSAAIEWVGEYFS